MALDFNILARVPDIGAQIMAGQEAGRARAAQNMLLQQRQLEFQQAQEDRSRKLEAERLQTEARPRLAQMLRQMGQNPGDLKAATEFTAAAFESNNPAAVTAGQEWIKLARELAAPEKPVVVGGRLVRPSTGEVVYQGPETAPRPIAIGNRLVSPTGEVVYEAPETPARPIAIGNRLVSPAGEVVYEAPPPPPPTPRPIAVGGRLVSPEGQVIYEPPPAPAAAERPVVVGGRLVSPTGQVIYEPPPGTMTPSERFVPVGPNVFNRETGQFLPGPAREPAFRQTPEARVKPAAPIRVRPGEVVISPETGQPIFTAPPAPARAPAAQREGAKPAEKPATVTEQQASTATQRLLNRATEIADIVQRNRKAEAPTMTEAAMENLPYLSRAANLVRSTDRQIVSSAQDDILDALLYLSTGAAYNKEQLQQQKSAYLPSWSDDPPTRQVKRQRLAQAIEGARVRAGRAWTPELDAAMQRLMEVPVMGGRAPGAAPAATGAAPAPAGAGRYQTLSNDELLRQLGVKPKGQ